MDASQDSAAFVATGLAAMGIEAAEDELAVARGAHKVWWPAIQSLLEADLHCEPESDPDLSRPPGP